MLYTGQAPLFDETAYTISGAYDPAQPLAGALTVAADPDGQYRAGEYAYAWPAPDPYYSVTLAGDASCTILGAEPTLSISAKPRLSTAPCAVAYTVQLAGDETGGVPAGVVALFVDGELLAENLALDESGALVYEAAGQPGGRHELTVTYTGGTYYYPAETTRTYQNYTLLLFLCLGGGLLVVTALVVFFVLRGNRKKAKKAAAMKTDTAEAAG